MVTSAAPAITHYFCLTSLAIWNGVPCVPATRRSPQNERCPPGMYSPSTNAPRWPPAQLCTALLHQLQLLGWKFRNNEVRLQLHALANNLANFMRTLALPKEVEHWSLYRETCSRQS